MEKNLVDHVWGTDQPERPENPIVPLELEFAGKSWEEKVRQIREQVPTLENAFSSSPTPTKRQNQLECLFLGKPAIFIFASKAEANPSGAPFPLASLANIRPGPNVTKLFMSVIYECS